MSISPKRLFPIREQAADSKFLFCRKSLQRHFWFFDLSLIPPLDKLSRSETRAYEIPDSSSEIYNTKSPRFTLVQVAPNHFVPIWDEVDFLKAATMSCGQLVHKYKTHAFNFDTNDVEVIFVFCFQSF